MAATNVASAVYIHVVEDVISKVRDDFINNGGPGETVLNELQGIWEMKMMQAGVLPGPIERSSAQNPTPGGPLTQDLNVAYEGIEEYETPTPGMIFSPTSLQTPLPTPLPGIADNSSMYNIPTGSRDYPTPGTVNGSNTNAKRRASPYMASPTPWSNPGLDLNVPYVDGRGEPGSGNSTQQPRQESSVPTTGKRKRDDSYAPYGSIPQQDGASDAITFDGDREVPQVDGPEAYDETFSTPNVNSYQGPNEDINEARTPGPDEIQISTPVAAAQNDIVEDEEAPLNEDDDNLEDLENDEDMDTHHIVLSQFDKVTRTKNRWRCNLRDGIMHINDKDMLFNKATGEFEF